MTADLFVKGIDGVHRSLDEHYDTMRDVEKDPYGAWKAIQDQAEYIEALEAKQKDYEEMNNTQDKLADLNRRFRYKADTKDKWKLLDSPTGLLYGDCEDRALTALYLMCDKSWLRFWWMVVTFQAVFWYCKTNRGNGHVVLWVKGYGWTDNIYPEWSRAKRHKMLYPYLPPMLLLSFLLK